LSDIRNKPLSSAKVKPAGANDSRLSALHTLCEISHIPFGRRTAITGLGKLAQPPMITPCKGTTSGIYSRRSQRFVAMNRRN
jgi:hypothetical protein